MRKFTITNEANQKFIIPFEDNNITVNVRFLTVSELWMIDISDEQGFILNGIKLASGVDLLRQHNKPYDFFINDDVGIGTDPFNINSFSDGLFSFYLLERSDLVTIRGYDVQ